MTYKFPKDIKSYLEKNPAYDEYLKDNRGDHRYVRCEYPQLMGWNTLRRPEWLPRSLKYPYFVKPYGIQARTQERLMKPHVNKVKLYRDSDESHSILKKAEIYMDEKPYKKRPWGEIRIGTWKKNGNARVMVKIFDKSKPEWETEEHLLTLETCKSQTIGHVNFVHYYGSLETKLLKYHVFEHMSRGNLLQVLRSSTDSNHPDAVSTPPRHENERHSESHSYDSRSSGSNGHRNSGNPNQRKCFLSDEVLRKMFCQILFAVSHLHDKDIVHRQVSSQTY